MGSLKNSLNSWLMLISGNTRCRLAPQHHSVDGAVMAEFSGADPDTTSNRMD